MENQHEELGEVEPTITHPTEEDLPARPNKGFAIDITSMDEEGTLKERKLKKLEEMKRRKIEDLEKRKRDHTPTQHKADKSPSQVKPSIKDLSKSPSHAGGPTSKSPMRRDPLKQEEEK